MNNTTLEKPEVALLLYFNQITGRNFRTNNKTYLNAIASRFKDGFTEQQMQEVIQVKTIEWRNNPEMAVHLNPETIFRPKNFEKYVNQVAAIKENPKLYEKYFKSLSTVSTTAADNDDAISALYG